MPDQFCGHRFAGPRCISVCPHSGGHCEHCGVHVRDTQDQFKPGVIVGYGSRTGFPLVDEGQGQPVYIHPDRLITEADFLALTGQEVAR